MDSVVVIPLERGEEDRAIWGVVFADGNVIGKELDHLQTEGVFQNVLGTIFVFLSLLNLFEGSLQGVEVEGLIS
jgi:hypothetical protein